MDLGLRFQAAFVKFVQLLDDYFVGAVGGACGPLAPVCSIGTLTIWTATGLDGIASDVISDIFFGTFYRQGTPSDRNWKKFRE